MSYYDHVADPLDNDHFSQEMEREAQDALYDAQFAVMGTCISCLGSHAINPQRLCETCEEMNASIGGSLYNLLTNAPLGGGGQHGEEARH